MNQTTHYALRKPEADDRILRDDFDHNWDAIDTAIHGAAASAEAAQAAVDSEAAARTEADTALEGKIGLQTLLTTTCSASSGSWNASLSSIDWSQWSIVFIKVMAKSSSSTSCRLLVNGSEIVIGSLPQNQPITLMLTPLKTKTEYFSGLCVSGSSTAIAFYVSTALQSVQNLTIQGLSGDYQVLSGSFIKVYGLK